MIVSRLLHRRTLNSLPAVLLGLLMLGCTRSKPASIPPLAINHPDEQTRRPRTVFSPETLVFPGNVVRLERPRRLFQPVQYLSGLEFEIRSLQSADDGESWTLGAPIARDSGANYYDPMVLRTSKGQLLLGSHRDGALVFFLSRDQGRTWKQSGRLAAPAGISYVEAFLRRLVHAGSGADIALAYAAIPRRGDSSWYELRNSSDDGRTWSQPAIIGQGGAIPDAVRPGLGPVGSDGTLLVAFSRRKPNSDTVEVHLVRMGAQSLDTRYGPVRIVVVPDVAPGVGVLPIIAECEDGPAVLLSTWNRKGVGRLMMYSAVDLLTARTDPARQLVVQPGSSGGFGRLWITEGWSAHTHGVFVVVPTPSRSRIDDLSLPELDGCRT
jgi:hypothetical protein